MSPWGGQTRPSLSPFVPRPDLEARLASIDVETAALRLTRAFELRVSLPGGGAGAVIRGYDGTDVAGRAVHAARVATPLGVVMAVGPLDAGDLDRGAATEIVPALLGGSKPGEASAFRTGTDLNGDGRLDVVLRGDSGAISIWHFDGMGSGAYDVRMVVAPSRGADLDGDGRVDLVGDIPPVPGDPIAPRFADVAMFAEGRYETSRAWHRGRARASIAQPGSKDEARLRASLERAWHTILGGMENAENVLRDLRRETVPPALAAAFARHVGTIATLHVIR